MINRILVPMDTSEMAKRALRFALENYPDGEITVLNVVGTPSWFMGEAASIVLSDDTAETAQAHAQPIHDRACEIAGKYHVEINTAVALGQPTHAIVERAKDYDIIIIGSHGRNLSSRLLLGNIAELVTRRSPVPVTVVR